MLADIDEKLQNLLEIWQRKFLERGYDFDVRDEIGIYPLLMLPYKRHQSGKRDHREFNAYPIVYWPDLDPASVEDFSRTCYEYLARQEKTMMQHSMEEYIIVIFPVIISDNVDTVALGHVQRYHVSRGADIEFPVIYDLELEKVYMRQFNPGKGDLFFHPYKGEVENILGI